MIIRERRELPQLCVTYHVGEDFLDLADGLRAIDEAVNFLNMECGDRLGHALALGIDVEEWYRKKNDMILISQQDYLDTLIWIYHRLIQFNIPDMGVFSTSIENEYALLACALENAVDQDGNLLYSKSMVYEWIDAVRKMGNEQSFLGQD